MFCLFGDRQLSQDELATDDRELHLVNNSAMEMSRRGRGCASMRGWSWCSSTTIAGIA